jgi:hypothetical protein
LQRLAVERLRRKVASLRWPSGTGRAASADDVAYRALLGALGQADNRAALERLALELPLAELRGLDRNMISERLLVEAERLERASLVRWERRGRPANRLEARLSAAAALLAEMLPELARKLTGLAFLEPREAVGALRVPGLLGPPGARRNCWSTAAIRSPWQIRTWLRGLALESGPVGRSRGGSCSVGWICPAPNTSARRRCGHASPTRGTTPGEMERARPCSICKAATAAWAAAPFALSDGWRGSRWRVRPGPARTSERLLVKWWAELGFGAGRRPEVRAIGQCASSFKIRD